MAKNSLSIVRKSLQAYADRGIFRGFSETKSGQFQFEWLIGQRMELKVDTANHILRFGRLLPGIASQSALYQELREFIRERHDNLLPDHRRIDRRQAEVSCTLRGGFVSISLKVKNNRYAYGVNRLVNLVHELFLHLRNMHPDYLMENFDVPQE